MEFVPYDFCEAVVAVFAEPSGPLSGLASPFWRRAIQKEASGRCSFDCTIGYTALGAWTLAIYNHKTRTTVTIEELCDPNKRNHRIVYIAIRHVIYPTIELSSFEEVKRLVTRIIPFVNMAEFTLDRTFHDWFRIHRALNSWPTIPLEPVLEIVLLLGSSSFSALTIDNEPAIASLEDFAMAKMKTKWLRKLSVCFEPTIPISCAFQSALEQFILEDAFRSVSVNWRAATFTKEFVAQLFDTHVDGTFMGFFNFPVEELYECRKSSQVPARLGYNNNMEWIREDGVQVRVEGRNNYISTINFKSNSALSA